LKVASPLVAELGDDVTPFDIIPRGRGVYSVTRENMCQINDVPLQLVHPSLRPPTHLSSWEAVLQDDRNETNRKVDHEQQRPKRREYLSGTVACWLQSGEIRGILDNSRIKSGHSSDGGILDIYICRYNTIVSFTVSSRAGICDRK
jgi:hypothetical protein